MESRSSKSSMTTSAPMPRDQMGLAVNARSGDRVSSLGGCQIVGGVRVYLPNLYRFASGRLLEGQASNRSALKITNNDTPMSAAIAVHNEACPESVKTTKTAFTAKDRTMLVRMIDSIRREC